MNRIIPIIFALLLSFELAAETIAGVDLSTLIRPHGVHLNYESQREEQSAKRNIEKAQGLIKVGLSEKMTENYYSQLSNKTIDKSDVRELGKAKIIQGEKMLRSAAQNLLRIYQVASLRAEDVAKAGEAGFLHDWTSTDDRTLRATFVELAGPNLSVMSEDGTSFLIPLDKIKDSDRIVAKIMQTGRGFNQVGFLDAVSSGSLNDVNDFLDAGFVPPTQINGDLIGICIRKDYLVTLERLMELQLDVNMLTSDGYSPLSLAVQAGNAVIVDKLLDLGARPLVVDTVGANFNSIEWALNKGDSNIASRLKKASEDELSDLMLSIVEMADVIGFKSVELEKVMELKSIENGKTISVEDLQTFKLSLFELEPTINDLELAIANEELRPLVAWFYAYDFYRFTINQNKDFVDSLIAIWEERDRNDDDAAAYSLALANIDGLLGFSDTSRAIQHLTEAAERKHTRSMVLLGDLISDGIVVGKEPYEAFDYYRSSAELDDLMGMVRLGQCYEEELHIPKNNRKGFIWYERAAEGGSTEGMAHLGRAYINGIGVKKDVSKGNKLCQLAADADNLTAMRFLSQSSEN